MPYRLLLPLFLLRNHSSIAWSALNLLKRQWKGCLWTLYESPTMSIIRFLDCVSVLVTALMPVLVCSSVCLFIYFLSDSSLSYLFLASLRNLIGFRKQWLVVRASRDRIFNSLLRFKNALYLASKMLFPSQVSHLARSNWPKDFRIVLMVNVCAYIKRNSASFSLREI